MSAWMRMLFGVGLVIGISSCGFISEDNGQGRRAGEGGQGEPSPDPGPSPVPVEGMDVRLGQRGNGLQKVIVRSEINPAVASASQFDLVYQPSELAPEVGNFSTLAAPIAALQKQIVCNLGLNANTVRCIVYGMNTTEMPNGDLTTLTFIVVNEKVVTPRVTLENVVMSTGAGTMIPLGTSQK